MSDKFDEHDLEYRLFRPHLQSLGFSSDFAGKLHDFMQEAHAELRTIGSSIPDETLAAYPEILNLAITYGKWHPAPPRLTKIPHWLRSITSPRITKLVLDCSTSGYSKSERSTQVVDTVLIHRK